MVDSRWPANRRADDWLENELQRIGKFLLPDNFEHKTASLSWDRCVAGMENLTKICEVPFIVAPTWHRFASSNVINGEPATTPPLTSWGLSCFTWSKPIRAASFVIRALRCCSALPSFQVLAAVDPLVCHAASSSTQGDHHGVPTFPTSFEGILQRDTVSDGQQISKRRAFRQPSGRESYLQHSLELNFGMIILLL